MPTDSTRYLLDTNVVSNLEKRNPDPRLLEWIAQTRSKCLVIPWSLAFEVQYGIELARPMHPERAQEKEEWLEKRLVRSKGQQAIPTIETARIRAKMYAAPPLRHFHIRDPNSNRLRTGEDLMIAATAITHGLTIVTFDVDDFLQIHRLFPLPGLLSPARGWVVELPTSPDRRERRYRKRSIHAATA